MTTQTGSGDFEPDFRCTQKILLAAKKALGELPDSPVRTFAELVRTAPCRGHARARSCCCSRRPPCALAQLQEDDATYVDAVVQRQPQFPASAMLVVATLLKRNMVRLSMPAVAPRGRVSSRQCRLQHLRSLCLNYNRLNDECVALLAGGVGGNGSVTSLYLVGNAFKIVGTRALAKAIEHTSSLTHLDLRQNAIAEFGGSALGASDACCWVTVHVPSARLVEMSLETCALPRRRVSVCAGVSCAKNRSLRTLVLRVAHLPVQELTGHVGVETLSLRCATCGTACPRGASQY
jgi:hypothetical protein